MTVLKRKLILPVKSTLQSAIDSKGIWENMIRRKVLHSVKVFYLLWAFITGKFIFILHYYKPPKGNEL